MLWVPQVQVLWMKLVVGLNSLFFPPPVLLLLPLRLKVVEVTPEILFLDPEGTQGGWRHPIPYLKAGLSWWGFGDGYLPSWSRMCWDWILATLGFWGLAEPGQSKAGRHVGSGVHQRAPCLVSCLFCQTFGPLQPILEKKNAESVSFSCNWRFVLWFMGQIFL